MYSVPPLVSVPILVNAPETWFQGSQSSMTSFQPAVCPSTWRPCAMFDAIMRWVWMTAFGMLVEPDVSM